MGKGLDTGKAFFQGLLSKITDPEQRAAADRLMSNESFLTEVGNGVEGQSEIDRQLQTLRSKGEDLEAQRGQLDDREAKLTEWHQGLTDWYGTHKAALDAAKKGTNGNPSPSPSPTGTPTPSTSFTKEQLDETLTGERAAFLGFQRDHNLITREHYGKFHEIVDLDPLLQHPQIATLGLRGVYDLVHKERLAKFTEEAAKAREETIRADERSKVLAGQAQMPYPSPTGVGSGSPLDALTAQGAKDSVAIAASEHYARLQLERAGAPGR